MLSYQNIHAAELATYWELIRGSREAPARSTELRAGDLSLELVGVDLRRVRFGDVDLLRRLHVAVRNEDWGTVPESIDHWSFDQGEDSFTLTFEARNREGPLDFSWRGHVEGTSEGLLTYSMDGDANMDFAYGRIGLVVLHPLQVAGRRFKVWGEHGLTQGRLPDLIGPQWIRGGFACALFEPYTTLELEHPGGLLVRFEFEGDEFEMEDERNWTDASFKTYSTPLALGGRHEIAKGSRLTQRVRMTVLAGSVRPTRRVPDDDAPCIQLGAPIRQGLPAIGFQLPSHGQSVAPQQLDLLRSLYPDHIRVDVDLSKGRSALGELKRGIDTALTLGSGVELAMTLYGDDLSTLSSALDMRGPGHCRIDRVLVLHRPRPDTTQPPTDGLTVDATRAVLGDVLTDTAFCAGTDGQFDDVNRTRPALDGVDGLAYSITPQFHAFDDLSILENLEAQGDTVRSAASLAPGVPVIVSPVTLRPRSAPFEVSGSLPTAVDPRQMSMLAAAWTLGSLSELLAAGVSSVTYYELNGWRGLMETPDGPPDPAFPSKPSMIFPVFHVFAALAGWRDAEVLASRVSSRLRFAVLPLRLGDDIKVLIANLRPTRETVEMRLPKISGTDKPHAVSGAQIDHEVRELTARADLVEVLMTPLDVKHGVVQLALGPYGLAVIEARA